MATVRWTVRAGDPITGDPQYLPAERSIYPGGSAAIRSRYVGHHGVAAVTVQYLQIIFGGPDVRVLYVTGLHPRSRWVPADFAAPQSIPGQVVVQVQPAEVAAVGAVQAAPGTDRWVTWLSPSGWVRIAADWDGHSEQLVQVATRTVLGVREHSLSSLWLQPRIVDDPARAVGSSPPLSQTLHRPQE